MRISLSSYELCLWLKPALKPACRRLWLIAEACTASRNIRRHAPTIILYYHPQPYVIIQLHCEIAHSVRLVELYIWIHRLYFMILRIYYGCPYYLLSLYGAPICNPPNRAYAYGGYSGTPGSIIDGRIYKRMWPKPARVAGACTGGWSLQAWHQEHQTSSRHICACITLFYYSNLARVGRLDLAYISE